MPTRNLKVALIPLDVVIGDKKQNLKHLIGRLENIACDTDLIVLPEAFSTGYVADKAFLMEMAEDNDGPTMSQIHDVCEKYGFAICGGFIATSNCQLYNRGFFVEPGGETNFYDKRHLFSMGHEDQLLSQGMSHSPIIRFRSWNIKMAICYDIRFPVWNRNIANQYDALIVPANWAHSRLYAWKHLLMARAIENQSYVLGCNREGADGYGQYERGDSFIFNHWGVNVADYHDDGTIYGVLDADKITRDRDKFSPWRDSDSFELRM